jgi:hypothetical protein
VRLPRATRAAVAVACALLLAACGGEGPRAATSDGPTASPSRAIDPHFQAGDTILITAGGFHPQILVFPLGGDVTFRNVTAATHEVRFLHGDVDSGPIAPGHAWRFHPDLAVAYAYFDATHPGFRAFIQAEPSTPTTTGATTTP